MCPQLRRLFVMILIFCNPEGPRALFDRFWITWYDDFSYKAQLRNIQLQESQLKTLVLQDIELHLSGFDKTLNEYNLPEITLDDLHMVQTLTNIQPAVIREELLFNPIELRTEAGQLVHDLNDGQRVIFNSVLTAVQNETPLRIFIDARGGCGKTYLLNTILKRVRSLEDEGCIALAMATTGIAANLLHMGRTFHSRLKAPLTVDENSVLNITVQSNLAKVVRKAKLLMIDESTMMDSYMLKALDRSLKDIMDEQNIPFGGKILILAGDFRQCLPVIKHCDREGIVQRCINSTDLWSTFSIKRLTINMRVRTTENFNLHQFDEWTLNIGNGNVSQVKIPNDMKAVKINQESIAMKKIVDLIFPDMNLNLNNQDWLNGRAILAVTNRQVKAINDVALQKIDHISVMLESSDKCTDNSDSYRFNSEYLNTLTPDGFPPHTLMLKPGIPLMLLRNLNPKEGLCNGTRLIFNKLISNRVLECTIVETKKKVLIPRITFIPLTNNSPMEWQRRQFPIKPAFAMTINKSQGQTMQMAGLYLRPEVFTHGQMYVALSRVRQPTDLKIAAMEDYVQNIVFKDVLI